MTAYSDIKDSANVIQVLDHGFVILTDHMGNDHDIAQSARTSYGKGTKQTSDDVALIRYLFRKQHTSPIEMAELKFMIKMPIFVARQHVRHRTACLSGDTLLDFDLPGNAIEHKYRRIQMKLSDFHNKWHFGEFGNKNQNIDLSWIENEKLYIASEIGSWFLNRKDQLKSVAILKKAKNNKLIPHYYGKDVKLFYANLIEKSNFKRDKLKTMNLRSLNEDTKELFYSNIVDIWKSGQKETYEISIRIDDKIINKIETSKDHLFFTEYGWKKLNDIKPGDKIWALTRSGNEIINESTGRLLPILDITSTGIKETYDIQVEGEFHNFSANGFIVHNSINEYSARYSIMSDECYLPELDRFQEQHITNKQASGDVLDHTIANDLRRTLDCSYVTAYDNYTYALDNGLSRELARIQLPVAQYTEMYWKIDLKNFFNYIKLRMDKEHAQMEIVAYAEAMYKLVKPLFPITSQAFEDYWLNSRTFSALELKLLKECLMKNLDTSLIESDKMSKNELNDFRRFIGELM